MSSHGFGPDGCLRPPKNCPIRSPKSTSNPPFSNPPNPQNHPPPKPPNHWNPPPPCLYASYCCFFFVSPMTP